VAGAGARKASPNPLPRDLSEGGGYQGKGIVKRRKCSGGERFQPSESSMTRAIDSTIGGALTPLLTLEPFLFWNGRNSRA